jgi:hypothetical protein
MFEVLSNFACSLRPNEEKYTFFSFEITMCYVVWKNGYFSDQRFAYEEAQYI